MGDSSKTPGKGRVRKRITNACTRCRKQKIKCSGSVPCEQCTRRSIHCTFDARQHKIYVSQSYIAQLERRAAGLSQEDPEQQEASDAEIDEHAQEDSGLSPRATRSSSANGVEDEQASDVESSHLDGARITPDSSDHRLKNPLDPNSSDSFTVNHASRRYFLGVTSNASFGVRVLRMVHQRVHGTALPAEHQLFEGSTYDLGWDGRRGGFCEVDTSIIPTADFALFLINAVKFHCGRLFHMFDESTFMHNFSRFYDDSGEHRDTESLWFIHFLLILAFGKAFIVRASKGKRPPGADLFVQAMQRLPDIMFLYSDPIQAIEILCCAALYLQCLDLRSAAYNVIGQAQRMAVEGGMYTDMESLHLPDSMVERCRQLWWTVYILDRHMTSLMGVPMGLSDDDITAPLPSFSGSVKKMTALRLHVELAKAHAVILQTVYGKSGSKSEKFLINMKAVLKQVAATSDERNASFPLELSKSASGICRLSAYLHLFHHQALILATRPLLYSYLQKRLAAPRSLRISSARGTRSLLRVCVSSAKRCINILGSLQSQSLLESFLPFDLDATFSSAIVLSIASAVDPSLVRDHDTFINTAHTVLDEMIWRGNLVADFHKHELEQLDANMHQLQEQERAAEGPNHQPSQEMSPQDPGGIRYQPTGDASVDDPNAQSQQQDQQYDLENIDTILSEWNSEDGLNGDQLLAMANCLDFEQLSWPDTGEFDQFLGDGEM